ncbi:molybdenum cofactor synthesis domain-containing protein [Algoriphagus hitonicola]|uniref:molybdenum cofactor synthesis domain-containing protein n=1 Tax=Algoriphagus hitonicola TaxID=435880 RepID=UPI0036148464
MNKKPLGKDLKAKIVVCSDSISAGKGEDKAGLAIQSKLEKHGILGFDYVIIPDEFALIQKTAMEAVAEKFDLVIFTGGTGLSPRDVTPDALEGIIERRIPGIEEAIRNYGQQRTPFAMLSRSIVGLIGETLIMGVPGSTKGAEESIDAVFPAVLHLFKVMEGASFRH